MVLFVSGGVWSLSVNAPVCCCERRHGCASRRSPACPPSPHTPSPPPYPSPIPAETKNIIIHRVSSRVVLAFHRLSFGYLRRYISTEYFDIQTKQVSVVQSAFPPPRKNKKKRARGRRQRVGVRRLTRDPSLPLSLSFVAAQEVMHRRRGRTHLVAEDSRVSLERPLLHPVSHERGVNVFFVVTRERVVVPSHF